MRAEIVDYRQIRETVEAAWPAKDFATIKQTLEPLKERADTTRSGPENLFLYSSLGRLYDAIEAEREALEEYQRAFEHDSRDRYALEALGRVLMDHPDHDQTLPVLQRLLVHHRWALLPSFVARIYSTIARHHQGLGDLDAARTAYEKALEVTPGDMDIINSLLDVAQESGDDAAVQAVRERLLTSLTNNESRAAVLVAIGDDYLQKLDDLPRAIEAYERALAECATSVPALMRIADLSVENGEWPRAVRALRTLGEVTEGVDERIEFLERAAHIYVQQLDSSALAIQVYNQILDLKPDAFDAFNSIAQLLTAEDDYAALDENFTRMIERHLEAGSGDKVMIVLYRNQGELRLSHLDDTRAAAESYQAASDRLPDDLALHQTLAELYSQHDDLLERAVDEHRAILRLAPDRLESVDALAGLYRRLERFDASLCVFRVLDSLDRADEEGKRIVERYSTHRAAKIEGTIDSELFAGPLRPEVLEPRVARLMALAQPALLSSFAHDLEHYRLREKDARFDLESDTFFSRIYKSTVETLGMHELPPVYVDKSRSGVRNAYLLPPAVLVGPDVLSGREEREIAFMCGKALTLMRPEFYLTQFGGHQVLEGVMYTVFKTFRSDLNINMNKNMQRVSKELEKRLKLDVQQQIRAIIDDILDSGIAVNLKLYLDATEDLANRVGLLLCDDLPTVRKLLEEETESLGQRNAANRFGSLLLWGLGDDYMELRRRLGIAID